MFVTGGTLFSSYGHLTEFDLHPPGFSRPLVQGNGRFPLDAEPPDTFLSEIWVFGSSVYLRLFN